MTNGCWKLDDYDKALYIDIEEEDESKTVGKVYSAWDQIPDIILEQIFSHLSIRERYYASLVCRSWYRAFKLQNVWSTFVLEDTSLTRGKFNYYSGWQYVLDHMRTSACINKIGRNIRSLVFEPMHNFYNLYEFMNMISWYVERRRIDKSIPVIGTNIRRLKFTFPCNMADRTDPERVRLFGTGGKLLEALKRLMCNLENLRCLELIDLMLDSKEALHLLDDICANCTQTMTKLVLINATKLRTPLIHVGVFLNLRILVISPQNLHEDVIELLGYTSLEHLHIFQNRYSPKDATISLPKNASWKKMRLNNPMLKVHFEIESHKSSDMLLPSNLLEHCAIPCHSIVLDNPMTQVTVSTITTHATFFDTTLRVYAFKGLTRHFLPREFSKRLDQAIVRFCKLCPNLHTLMIRDKISTATILEIVSVAKSLRCLYVRRNVVLKKCDNHWIQNSEWSPNHLQWVKENSCSYEKTERQVSAIFGYRWHMLSEKDFQAQTIHLHR